jgi:hypothetical protein
MPPVEQEIRRVIRDARAKDPLISITKLKELLEKHFNDRATGFSHNYVSKLADKVSHEALIEVDRAKIEHRIVRTRENYRIIRERLLEIIYWRFDPDSLLPQKAPLNRDVIEAAKNLVMMDLALLNAEITAGIYRTAPEAAEHLRYAPMPEERRQIVINTFVRWGMLPEAMVQTIVGPARPPVHATTRDITTPAT